MLFVVLPFHFVEFRLEGVVLAGEHPWEMVADVDVKVSPVQLVYQIVLYPQLSKNSVVDLSDGDRREM